MEFKKWFLILIILIFSFFLIDYIREVADIKFKDVKDILGRATQDTTSARVEVVAGDTIPPNLTLMQPSNRNYTIGKGMWIYYSAADDSSNLSSVWYNLDNGTNYTLPLPSNGNTNTSSFNTSIGNYTFYIFANDTKNNVNNSASVSFSVVNSHEKKEIATDSNGNLIFTDPTINEFIQNISGLNTNWTINFTLHTNNTPSGWDTPTNTGDAVFYFEIFPNTMDDTAGNFTIYFNISKGRLENIAIADIRGFYFNNNTWNELSTTVKNSADDPIGFSVSLTHLSRFLISEKGAGGSSGGGGTAGGASGGGGSPSIPKVSKPQELPRPESAIPEIPEISKEEKPKKIPLLINKFIALQELPLLNVIIIFLVLAFIVLIIFWAELKMSKRRRK